MLNQITVIAQREDHAEKYFKFETPSYSPSLFKDPLMCKPGKPALRIDEDAFIVDAVTHSRYALNGSAVLHQVRW